MFEIGWSELLVIAVVAIIVVGPKELPRMLRTFGGMLGKMRRMAGEFQTQFNEVLREAERQADLDDVKKHVESARKFDPLKDVRESLTNAVSAPVTSAPGSTAAAASAAAVTAPVAASPVPESPVPASPASPVPPVAAAPAPEAAPPAPAPSSPPAEAAPVAAPPAAADAAPVPAAPESPKPVSGGGTA
jgi:sec-independent protein translocase protein TatB